MTNSLDNANLQIICDLFSNNHDAISLNFYIILWQFSEHHHSWTGEYFQIYLECWRLYPSVYLVFCITVIYYKTMWFMCFYTTWFYDKYQTKTEYEMFSYHAWNWHGSEIFIMGTKYGLILFQNLYLFLRTYV